MEQDPDEASGEERRDGQTDEHPQDLRVDGDGDEGLTDGGAEGVGQQVHALDETLHAGRRLGVGVLETRDAGENLGDTDEHVGGGLHGDYVFC